MKKSVICMAVAIAVLAAISSVTLVGCGDKEIIPREVVLELINPNTGEVMKSGERIDLPKEDTYVKVKIKDKETEVYLTDDDLPDNTIKGSLIIGISLFASNRFVPLYTGGYWPTEVDPVYDYYRVAISFDSKPKNITDSKFQRSYKMTNTSYRIYFNRQKGEKIYENK